MRIFFIAFFVGFFVTANAQKSVEDSIETELSKHTAQDTIRIKLLLSLMNETYDRSRALAAANEIIVIGKKLGLPSKEALGYFCRASSYYESGKNDLFYADLQQAATLYQHAGDKKGLVSTLRGSGRYFESISSYSNAIEYYTKAIGASKEAGLPNIQMQINIDIGNCYYQLGDYTKSVQYYLLSRQQAEQASNLKVQAKAIDNIARVNKDMKKYSTAIEEYKNAMVVYSAANDSNGYAKTLQGIGIVYDLQLKTDSALYYYFKAKDINSRNSYQLNLAENFSNIGITYLTTKQYSNAYEYLNKAVKNFEELNRSANIKEVKLTIGQLLCAAPDSFFIANKIPIANRYSIATALFKDVLKYGEEAKVLTMQISGWKEMASLYEKQGDYKNAYHALDRFHTLSDSLLNVEKIEATTKQTAKFEFDKKEAVTLIQHGLEIKHERTIKTAIAIGAAIVLIGAFVYFLLYKRKRDAVAKQHEAEFKSEVVNTEMKALRAQMNPHFIFNSLNSIGDYIVKNNIPEAKNYLSKFSKLMRKILENSEQKDVPIAEDLKALELYMELEALRMNNKFTYEIKVDDAIDKDAVLIPPLILQPFVENSIWHGIAQKEGNGKILIHIKKENDDMINCIVEDNGVGRLQSTTAKIAAPKQDKTSMGMTITQARIGILNKIKQSNATVQLTDLVQGVRVEVKLPLTTSF